MPNRPPRYRPACTRPTPSPSAVDRPTAAQRGYGARWQKARLTHLASHPLCIDCKAAGRVVEATVVDHKIPHKGDQGLFWDSDNWQSLCKQCHDAKTVREDGGFGRAPAARDGP